MFFSDGRGKKNLKAEREAKMPRVEDKGPKAYVAIPENRRSISIFSVEYKEFTLLE